MKIDVTDELQFATARSGGKGGQNVNKVETMVEGRWDFQQSQLLTDEQKQQIAQKLANKITAEGVVLVKSQKERTQMGNRREVIRKMNELAETALHKKKSRIATKPSKAVKEKRLEGKRIRADKKSNRQKIKLNNY